MRRDERYEDMITVRTGELTDGRIFQEIEDVHGGIVRKVADVAAMQLDEAVRAKLIELGWTPPEEFKVGDEVSYQYGMFGCDWEYIKITRIEGGQLFGFSEYLKQEIPLHRVSITGRKK